KIEAISFADLGIEKDLSTDDAKEVKEGLGLDVKDNVKYDSGIVLDNVTSEVSSVFLRTDYNYSEYNGVIYNTSEDEEMLINITDIDGKFITEISLSPGSKTKLENTLGGMEGIYIKAATESDKGS